MTSHLFRQAAVQGAGDKWLGSPIALIPTSWWALTTFFVIFTICVVVFLATATFPRKESAVRVVRYSLGEIRVSAARPGIVTALHVQDGQVVEAGHLLAYIATEQHLAAGDVYDARVLAAVERERGMLQQRLVALDASEPLQKQALSEHIASIAHQLIDVRANRRAREGQALLAEQSAAAVDGLVKKGVLSVEQQRTRREHALAAEQAVAETSAEITSLQSQSVDLTLQLARLPSDIAQTRASIMGDIEALEEKRVAALAQNGFALVAQVAGTVTAIQARLGQPADTLKPLMAIIPRGSHLLAELYIPSRAIGFVDRGQTVRLLYDAFPYTRFGPGVGTVAERSSAVLMPDEVTAAVKVTEPVYRVTVDLQDDFMSAYGRRVPLQSGMALTADIILENRSFLAPLLDPLLAARGRVLGMQK